MTNITTLHYKGRTYEIGKLQGWYVAIEDKFIDENGRLTKQMNGLQMKANKSLERTIEEAKQEVDIDELVSQGMNQLEASIQVIMG